MKRDELIKAMCSLRDDMTGKIRECDGCGHEYGCSVHGCAIINEAIAQLQLLARDIDVLTKERDAYAKAFRITTGYEPQGESVNEQREKLIEILSRFHECLYDETMDCNECDYKDVGECCDTRLADHLIANGVVVLPCRCCECEY